MENTDEYTLTRLLDTIAGLAPRIEELKYASPAGDGVYSRPTPGSRPPCALTWVDVQRDLEQLLRVMCRQVCLDSRDMRVPPPSRLDRMVVWLRDRADMAAASMWLTSPTWWEMQGGQGTLLSTIETITGQLVEALDPPMRDAPARTAPELAVLLGISPERIRQWKARGKLTPIGRRGAAHLYPVDVVQELATNH